MYQYTVIVGNVGRDPELRYTPGGAAVCDFSVAVNRRWTGQDGQQNEKTTWFRVTCWNKLAEVVNQYVTKGRQILVTGEVDASAWVDNDGNARATLEMTARDVKFLGSRQDDFNGGFGQEGGGSGPGPSSSDLQDIPF
ncbi:MAG: single-stranded DNA-binding protein [Anaerolineae bacterium]|nr:single-stranded DNA-binding protein [Anaerolineae bacterium]